MIIGSINKKKIKSNTLTTKSLGQLLSHDSVKLSILTTLAGYLEKNTIEVKGKEFYDRRILEKFLSYILNDKRAAPKKFSLKIKFDNSQNPYKSSVADRNSYNCLVSLSGGLDSTAGLMYALDRGFKVKPIWIGFGQKNKKKELRAIRTICSILKLEPLIMNINLDQYVKKGWNRWKMGIIPARNLLFAAVAASIAGNSTEKEVQIYICAHKEEITPTNTDKSKRFYRMCTAILSKAENKKIIIKTPFKKITKPEIVAYWVKNWQQKYSLKPQGTVSCYFGKNCGVCKACINRIISFLCAGIPLETYLQNPFTDSSNLLSDGYISRFSKLEIERRIDIIYSMNTQRKILPEYLTSFLDKNYHKYRKLINKRIRKMNQIRTI